MSVQVLFWRFWGSLTNEQKFTIVDALTEKQKDDLLTILQMLAKKAEASKEKAA